MIKRSISKRRLLLVIIDLIIVIGSIFLSSIIVIGSQSGIYYIKTNYFSYFITGCIYIFAFYMADLYDFRKDFRAPSQLFTIACASIAAFIIATFCFYVNWSLRIGRGVFLMNGILITYFLISWRYLYSHLMTQPKFQKKGLIVGAGWAGKTIFEEIKKAEGYGLRIIGFLDDDNTKMGSKIDSVPVICNRSNLLEVVKENDITQIVVAITGEKHVDLLKDLIKCSQDGVAIADMPALFENLTGKIPFNHIDDLWLLNSLSRKSKFQVQKIKRVFDVISSFILLMICSPIIPIIAFLIKRNSEGSIFYVQERLGMNNKRFKIIKFRSMVQNAEEKTGAVYVKDQDERVTSIGKFLRKWRLDEIPQLINVFKGDMSLVGPRPEREVFINEYQEKIPFYVERLLVRPGLTGWAQVKFPYASSVAHTEEKLQYDLFYIKNMSILLDIIILLQTVKVILFGKGK